MPWAWSAASFPPSIWSSTSNPGIIPGHPNEPTAGRSLCVGSAPFCSDATRRKTISQNSTKEAAFGADVKRLPLKDLVKRIGPGLIATGIVIGPGAVTTSARLGANYGYDLIWLIFPIIFRGMTFMRVTDRLAIVTGMPTIHAIRT